MFPETVFPETVSPETVSPETVSPETVSPEAAPRIAVPARAAQREVCPFWGAGPRFNARLTMAAHPTFTVAVRSPSHDPEDP